MPRTSYLAIQHNKIRFQSWTHGVIYILGLLTICFIALLIRRRIADLPDALLKDLKDAEAHLDGQAVKQVIDRIREVDAPVADVLAGQAKNYLYNRIINIIPAE